MDMLDRVNDEMAKAMRAQDRHTLGPLRMLKTALVHRRVEQGQDLNEDEAQRVAFGLVKQRRDSIEQFTRAGRQDLVDRETAELALLSTFLPPPMDATELERLIDATIAELEARSPKDVGRVMKAVMATLGGKGVDGATVSSLVKGKLSS